MDVTTGDTSITSGLPQQSVDEENGVDSSVLEYLVIAVCALGSLLNAYELVHFTRIVIRQTQKIPTTAFLLNQFSLDGFVCVFAVVSSSLRTSSIQLVGQTGSWLCRYFYSNTIVRVGLIGSAVNLVLIAMQLYVEIQHPVLYRKYFRMWMVWLAIVFAWIDGILLNNPLTWPTRVDRGKCYVDNIPVSQAGQLAFGIFGFIWKYFLPVSVLFCCYLRVIVIVRRRGLASPGHVSMASSISLQLHQQQQREESTTGRISCHQVKVIMTMTVLSLYFIVFWAPANFVQLYLTIANKNLQFNQAYNIAVFIGLINIATGPLIHVISEASSRKPPNIKVHPQATDEHALQSHNSTSDVSK